LEQYNKKSKNLINLIQLIQKCQKIYNVREGEKAAVYGEQSHLEVTGLIIPRLWKFSEMEKQ